MQAERDAFLAWVADVDPRRLVFLDESGANLAMGRSHAWLRRGTEFIDPRPMNWGDNLTLIGAIRVDRWLTLATTWGAINTSRFVAWVRRHLTRHLRSGDIVVLDNLVAHKARRARELIEARGATVRFLPPYSHDFNPIEAAWALMKKRIKTVAPRTGPTLRRTAQRACRVVRPRHCANWFAHAATNSSDLRGQLSLFKGDCHRTGEAYSSSDRVARMKQLARWVSILAHPFVMVAVLVAVPAMRQASGSVVQPVLLVVVAVVVPIAVLMFRQVRRGRWSNVDASKPSERPVLFMVALAGLAAALLWLLLNDPQSFLVRGMLVVAALLLFTALLNRWVKLSLHVAFAALTATALGLLGSSVGYALILVVPVVFWSRLALSRHSVYELVVGLVLGAFAGIVLVEL